MSTIEIILIVAACIIPVVAFFMVLPKRKKKEKVPPPTNTYVKEEKKEEKPATQAAPTSSSSSPKELAKPKVAKPIFDDDEDFKSYLELKKKRTPAPEPIEEGSFVRNPVGEYIPARLRTKIAEKNDAKSIKDQINELSPELKAMLIAGVLDRKDY